jgi:SAM-dependent methyltransferase/uncharacterized protein YbaR (Trm112 family)
MQRLMSLEESIKYLVSPREKEELTLRNNQLISNNSQFEIRDGLPLLFIQEALQYEKDNQITMPYQKYTNAIEQYLQINTIKMYYGNHNSDYSSDVFKTHTQRTQMFTKHLSGTVLDIGCDNPQNSLAMFSDNIRYLGLDPLFETTDYFRIIGMAEFLPIKSHAFDNVCFNTSLDHVLDYYAALKEAHRVLKPRGKLFISTLIWRDNTELYYDHVHFHHFKEYEIHGALNMLGFSIEKIQIFPYRQDNHRMGLYLIAEKS